MEEGYDEDYDEGEGEEPKKKKRKTERDDHKNVRINWAKRGPVKYGREWETHSDSYIKELVRQVQGYKGDVYSKVGKAHFERVSSSTYHIATQPEVAISKYLHLKSSDNDLAGDIDTYLQVAYDAGVCYVIIILSPYLHLKSKIIFKYPILIQNISFHFYNNFAYF